MAKKNEVVLDLGGDVTVNLDIDPNDPRNHKPAEALPSLDD